MPVLYQLSYSVLEALTGLEPATIGLNVVPQAFMPDHSKPKNKSKKQVRLEEQDVAMAGFPAGESNPGIQM